MAAEDSGLFSVFAPCAFTWANKGDAALVLALIQSLRDGFGEADVVLTSFTPELDSGRYGVPVLAMPLSPTGRIARGLHRLPRRAGLPWLSPHLVRVQVATTLLLFGAWARLRRATPELAARLLPLRIRKIVAAIDQADMTVAVPGGYLMAAPKRTDAYWMYQAVTLAMAKLLGQRVVLYPCSLGPFPGPHRPLARWLLQRCDLILLREEESIRHLKEIGVRPHRIQIVPDAAFGLRGDEHGALEAAAVVDQVTQHAGSVVGVSVRSHSFPGHPEPERAYERYLATVAAVCDGVAARFGGRIVFVPQAAEDVTVSRDVHGMMSGPQWATVVEEDLSPLALRVLYAHFTLLIGTRMHANILAMSSGTPVVAIAYEHKTDGIMRMLGLEEFVVGIADVPDRLEDVVLQVLPRAAALRAIFQQRYDRAAADTARSVEAVRAFLAERPSHSGTILGRG